MHLHGYIVKIIILQFTQTLYDSMSDRSKHKSICPSDLGHILSCTYRSLHVAYSLGH